MDQHEIQSIRMRRQITGHVMGLAGFAGDLDTDRLGDPMQGQVAVTSQTLSLSCRTLVERDAI